MVATRQPTGKDGAMDTDSVPQGQTLSGHHWKTRYRSTQTNLLHDFYIPALSISIAYDRVAGYFRSTSLAVASQGFSAFVRKGGKVRMVVGADLDPNDVSAILEGDAARLEQRLKRRLECASDWPESVVNGVTLLAWMVEHGHLELRVALRINIRTGEPLPFESMEDGYVDEKWALFRDVVGNRLLMSGSLNESKTALLLNAENIDVHCNWWSEHDGQRVEEAERDFASIWGDTEPGMRVLPLPEAVREQLVHFSRGVVRPLEIDGSSEIPPEVPEPGALERLKFAILRDAPRMPNGRFVGMETAPVEPWPYQHIVARRLIEAWPFSFLLCDEVGLGKTIENGLAFRSLYLSGIVKKILIAPPASLTRQWHNELKDKFFLPFARAVGGPKPRHEYIHPERELVEVKNLFGADLCIVSTGLIARKERAKEVKASGPWDIVLVDEAHYARRKHPQGGVNAYPIFGDLYRTLNDVLRRRTRALWLATAIPMQIDPIEVYDLLRLTYRVGPFQEDPELTRQYYAIHGRLLNNRPVSDGEVEFLRQALYSIRFHDPLLQEFIHSTVIEPRTRSDTERWLERGHVSRPNLNRLSRLIFSGAPLSRVMMRHTRSLLDIYRKNGELRANLARRTILPIPPIRFTTQEQQAYDQLEVYSNKLEELLSSQRNMRTSTAFYLSFLRLRFASSLYAIARTLERRRERVKTTLAHHRGETMPAGPEETGLLDSFFTVDDVGDDESIVDTLLQDRSEDDLEWEFGVLDEMLSTSLYDVATTSSKMQTLLGIIQRARKDDKRPGRIKQTVISTRFYDTLTDIVNRFRKIGTRFAIGTYSGQGGRYTDLNTGYMIGVERNEIKRRFLRGQIDILVCTDAAAEGLNLQTADLLINFDLPWNPAKVEQRIGRIDRIGQLYPDIYVQNLCYLGSAEEIVYGRLLYRLGQANDVVGRQQISMLPLNEEDFLELAEGKIDEPEITKRAQERITANQRRSEAMEIPAEDLYGIYKILSKRYRDERIPVRLADIREVISRSEYLAALGCESERIDAETGRWLLKLKGVPAIPDGTALTTDRKLYDEGTDALEGKLHFASYGEPVFNAVLEQINQFELPSCVRRISVIPEGLRSEYLAYLVADKSTGATQVKMVMEIAQTESVILDEDYRISAEDIHQFQNRLARLADEEFQFIRGAHRLELDNQRATFAQATLALGVIVGLLEFWRKMGRLQGDFRRDVADLENFIAQRFAGKGGITVHNIPKEPMDKTKVATLLFPAAPKMADPSWYLQEASSPVLYAGLAAAKRIADRMKRDRSKLSTDAVMKRMKKEMTRLASRIS